MQLPSNCSSLFKVDSEDFLICTGKTYSSLFRPHQPQSISIFSSILDTMGELSAKAQALKQIITNSIKFLNSDQRIYIKVKENRILGFIKVGERNLFYRDFIGNIKEIGPTCVLDFYVHQSCQRTGIGKEIFQKFLRSEGKVPQKLAYDRPSEKLLGFLKKHYGLVKFIPQNNNYVIYDKYFSKQQSTFTKNQLLYSKQTPIVLTPQQPKSSHQKIRPKTYLPSSSTSQQKLEPQQKHNAPTSSKLQKLQKIEQKQKLPIRPPSSKPQYTKLSNYPFEQQTVQVPQSRLSNRQFQQFHKKHKNISSEQFPLSNNTNQIPASQSQKVVQKPKTPTNINTNTNKHANTNINTNTNNNTNTNTNANSITNNNIYFRTTSNTYGNHYTYTNINSNGNINININSNNNGGSVGTFGRRR